MKKFMCFLLLLIVALVIPFNVFAEGEEEGGNAEEVTKEVSKKVQVYFFRGEGCPHCQEAEEWFNSLDDATKEKFEIVDYETWQNTDNAELMSKVAEVRGETDTATGVPYIIIGDKSWVGYSTDMNDEILSQIDSVYKQDVEARYDALELVENPNAKKKEEKSNDTVALIVLLVIVAGVCFGVYKARESVK